MANYLGVITSDFSLSPWVQDRPWLDAVITDPPYGIRERTTKVGTVKDYSENPIPDEYLDCHYPQKVSYSLEHLLTDLLNFSARSLVAGGRLVYWLPVIRQGYTEDSVPSHPALELITDCEQVFALICWYMPFNALFRCNQVLSSNTSRRLIVMQRRPGADLGSMEASVLSQLAQFRDLQYLPLAGNISRKERKARIKEHGHLNLTEEEIKKFSSMVKT